MTDSLHTRARFAVDNPEVLHSPAMHRALIDELLAENARCHKINRTLLTEAKRLDALINKPETVNFLEGVRLEAAHQVQRWGYAHDRSKSAENWFWLVGYLAGKALRAAITGDREKAKHHTISSAAALLNWHSAISGDTTGAGVGQDDDLRETNPMDARAADEAKAA